MKSAKEGETLMELVLLERNETSDGHPRLMAQIRMPDDPSDFGLILSDMIRLVGGIYLEHMGIDQAAPLVKGGLDEGWAKQTLTYEGTKQ